jgi:predicted NUDIX family phosphoesterase
MDHGAAIRFLEEAGVWFGPRGVLEEREDYRQIIPYIVLRVGDRIVRYTRTPAGGETRLHGRMSIGLGGHVDLADSKTSGDRFELLGTVEQAAERELQEELGEVMCERRQWVGLLVDNQTAVGRVHIGLIGIWNIDGLPNREAEDAVGEVELVSLSELRENAEMLETWSAMLLPWLERALVEAGSVELLT